MSETATTRIPAEASRKARGPPTFPKPWTTARAPASSIPLAAKTARTQRTTPDAVAPEWQAHAPHGQGFAGDDGRDRSSLQHVERCRAARP